MFIGAYCSLKLVREWRSEFFHSFFPRFFCITTVSRKPRTPYHYAHSRIHNEDRFWNWRRILHRLHLAQQILLLQSGGKGPAGWRRASRKMSAEPRAGIRGEKYEETINLHPLSRANSWTRSSSGVGDDNAHHLFHIVLEKILIVHIKKGENIREMQQVCRLVFLPPFRIGRFPFWVSGAAPAF
jgi:hypothetical protein